MKCDLYPCKRKATKHFVVDVETDTVDVDLCYHHATYTKSERNNKSARHAK